MKAKSLLASENPTPFIFILIILLFTISFLFMFFLILYGDFSPRTYLEQIQLPLATTSVADKRPPEERIMINLAHVGPGSDSCKELEYDMNGRLREACGIRMHWKIKIMAEEFNIQELEYYLMVEGSKYSARELPTEPEQLGISNRPVIIRAEAGAPWELVKKVLSACNKARIWKIEFGANSPPR